MDFRIVIEPGATAQQQQVSQGQQPGEPAGQLPATSAPGVSPQTSRDWRQEYKGSESRLLAMREQFGQDMPSTEAARLIEEERTLRIRRNEVMRERMKQDTAEMEARRNYEDEIALRTRQMEILRERHRIDGAAAEEAKLQLAQQKEAKEWQEKLNAERRKQDPASARAEDFEKIGGLMGQLSGGGGSMGLLGKILQMAPQFHEQFGGSSAAGGSSGVGGGAAGAGAAGATAGAAGGAAGGLAAMAGPVGLAITAVEMGAKKSADDIRGTSEAIQGFGQTVRQLNSNDYMGAFQSGVSGTAKSLEKIPIVGQIAAAHVERFGVVVGAAGQVIESFVQRGAELEKFSGNIAMSRSVADVRSMMGDIREASVMGDVIARITDSSSEIMDLLREISLPFKELAGEAMSMFLDLFKAVMEAFAALETEYGFIKSFVRVMIAVINWLRARLGIGLDPKDKDEKLDLDTLIKENLGNFLPANANQFGFGIGNNPLPGGGF